MRLQFGLPFSVAMMVAAIMPNPVDRTTACTCLTIHGGRTPPDVSGKMRLFLDIRVPCTVVLTDSFANVATVTEKVHIWEDESGLCIPQNDAAFPLKKIRIT